MTKSHSIRITVATLAGAACLAPSALASWRDPVGAPEAAAPSISYSVAVPASPAAPGEPKNVVPFTAPVTVTHAAAASTGSTGPQGESKNVAPFSAPYTDTGLALAYAKVAALEAAQAGESKSGTPFTGEVASGAGFSWADAAIGAASTLAVCLLVLAVVLAFRRRTESGSLSPRVGHA